MGSKKSKLLQKYLSKKRTQKERDALFERVRELQKDKAADLLPSSELHRSYAQKRTCPKKEITKKEGSVPSPLVAVSRAMPVKNHSQEHPTDGIVLAKKETRTLEDLPPIESNPAPPIQPAPLKTPKTLSRTRESNRALPITYAEDEIVTTIKENYVTIVSGGTGTGKSTQVPQFLYENGFTGLGKICLTQPRRVSTRAIAARISDEQQTVLGALCGYKIRYENMSTEATEIFVMTEGMLLQELSEDPHLSKYSVVILDEVHERSMISDVLLMVLLKLAVKTGIRIVLMSASLTQEYVQSLSRTNLNIPLIRVDPQTYEVERHYLPSSLAHYHYLDEIEKRIVSIETGNDDESFGESSDEPENKVQVRGAPPKSAIPKNTPKNTPKTQTSPQSGSILVFVATKAETEILSRRLEGRITRRIFSLHSDTTPEMQDEILKQSNGLIIATNVAETSLTLPDVKYVVDGGREITREFSYASNAYSYKVSLISKSSAEQRSGRTGRTGPGIAYHIYTTVEYEGMKEARDPEILRERALPAILPLLRMGIQPKHIPTLPFLTPPPAFGIKEELCVLSGFSFIKNNELTANGRLSLQIPIDPLMSAAVIRIALAQPKYLPLMIHIAAVSDVCSTKKLPHKPTHTVDEDKRQYLEAISLFPSLSPSCKDKISQIDTLIRSCLKALLQVTPGTDLPTGTEAVSTCISVLVFLSHKNLVTLFKGKFYHRGEEVLVESPLPSIVSEEPVLIVYHSLVEKATTPLKKLHLHLPIISQYD
ncbi:hypothetical protein NEDG_01726 [Nematocida displodere]|uniref:ATP-dependent RNA helicase DHR2 n=1 Tax=Nematocida displodere TaxID=1805483 RepID=A0A177EDV4_9MICR|nr:hypothetical protein NEDG_01726 [Nematocida displodere]